MHFPAQWKPLPRPPEDVGKPALCQTSASTMTDSTNLITLTSFCLEHAADKELAILMNSIQLSCKFISRAVRKAGIANLCANPHRVLSTERQGPFALGIFVAARHDRHPR